MPTTDLMTALPISAVTFMPQWRQEFSRQAGGTPRVADIGPEVWSAKITASVMGNDDAVDAAAIVNQMRGSLGTFYVWDVRRQYPRMDADGSILGSNVVTIYALGSDNKSLQLTGLPAGYQISRGDKLCWDQVVSSRISRCFHEFSADATADGSGVLPLTEVSPHIRTGASTGLVVSLKRPAAEMMIVPGSYDFPSNGPTISSLSFSAVQVPVGFGIYVTGALFTNTNVFYGATVTIYVDGALFTNENTFYAATVTVV